MAKVTVSGHSDDLIEVDGDISEEFSSYDMASHVTFNDGTVLRCEYSPDGYDGKWRIECVKVGTAMLSHSPAQDDEDNYSDVVTLEGDIYSVECWEGPEPSASEIYDEIENGDRLRGLSTDKMRRIWGIIKE